MDTTTRLDAADLVADALEKAPTAIAYDISRRLAASFPGKAILEGDACPFDVARFAAESGQCTFAPRDGFHSQIATGWEGPEQGLSRQPENAWFVAEWRGHALDVLLVSWPSLFGRESRYWIVADDPAVAERFFLEVCEWAAEVRDEVLVFDGGAWHKSADLFHAIQTATFDNLVLRGDLKQQIQDDLARFFGSREMYARHKVPWKRGILLVGPPGNGKTHTVKALINQARQPCLYVKSFKADYRETDHDNIRKVFRRARQSSPCLLVLEDLDSLIDGENRSFFLNELDGFAANEGIVTLATTNHPERLDPAIVDRPSRFDRKYPFDLPGPEERLAYLRLWNASLQPDLRLSEEGMARVVERTEAFSFAYLKELFLSATMRWINQAADEVPATMDTVMAEQAGTLREQMRSGASGEGDGMAAADEIVTDDPVAVGPSPGIGRGRRRRAGRSY
jgi:hypothetical protein